MKKYFIILVVAVALSGCEKDAPIRGSTSEICSTSAYKRAYNSSVSPRDITETSDGGALLLSDNGQTPQLMKLDNAGNVTWTKDYTSIAGKAQNITPVADGFIFAAAADEFNVDTSGKRFVYHHQTISYTPDDNCENFYVIEEAWIVSSQNQSKCTLTKTDAEGNLKWSKVFKGNYFPGKAVAAMEDGSLILITFELYGKNAIIEAVGTYEKVTYSLDKNIINVYSLSEEGEINWHKQISNIFYFNWDYIYENCNISATGSEILVQYPSGLIRLNSADRSLLSHTKPVFDHCAHKILDAQPATGGLLLHGISHMGSYSPSGRPYLSKVDNAGNVVWRTDIEQGQWPEMIASGQNENYLTYRSGNLAKYRGNGNLIWSNPNFQKESGYDKCMTASCNGGAIVAYQFSNTLHLIKTDANGNF